MKALIIEDEIPASKHLRQVLEQVGDITVVGVIDSISDTVEWFRTSNAPDIVFMDIHLADGLAFEIFNHVSVNCPVVFTTAYDEYALRAFRVNSIDYLLKPIEVEDVKDSLRKLKVFSSSDKIKADLENLINTFRQDVKYKTHFLVPAKGDKLIPVHTDDLACLFIDTGVVKAITYDEKSYYIDYTLDELMEMLKPDIFFRANRQYIISRSAVRDIDLWFNNRLSVNLKVRVPEKILISKARISEFKRWFGA